VVYRNVNFVVGRGGKKVVMSRNADLILMDEQGRERERHRIPYGARLLVEEGTVVPAGTVLAQWDPYTRPILTEVQGIVKFGDLVEGITVVEQVDEVTGLSQRVVIPTKDINLRPRVSIKNPEGRTIKIPGTESFARYFMPVGAILQVQEGQEVLPGDVLATIPREISKTKDITGGLPRVTELFEARRPRDYAIISEIDGVVRFGEESKGKRSIIVVPEVGDPQEYLIPKGKHILVHEGDYIRAGESLVDGPPNPHDILRVLGEKELAKYLVDEIQQVYRLQGVSIHDKHIEVVVRQMLKRVRILEPGDTSFLPDEAVEKWKFDEENRRVVAQGGEPATAEPLLMGITKSALATDSWISAASFQETTRVLTDASIHGKIDYLRGIKENIIMGRLIPAGTGNREYQKVQIVVEEPGAVAEIAEKDEEEVFAEEG
jgi:DNA-directed RNA polymerase subunit beta'